MGRVLLLTGTCGSGKSTVAQLLADRHSWIRFSENDAWRAKFHKNRGAVGSEDHLRKRRIVREEIFGRIRSAVAEGSDVVVDATVHEQAADSLGEYATFFAREGLAWSLRVLHPRLEVAVLRDAGRPGWWAGAAGVESLWRKSRGRVSDSTPFWTRLRTRPWSLHGASSPVSPITVPSWEREMKRLLLAVAAVAMMLAPARRASAQVEQDRQAIVGITPEQVRWFRPPYYTDGRRRARLLGNSAGQGEWVDRVEIPRDSRVLAHTHPQDELVTVIRGTWYLGAGARFNPAKLKAYPDGSFIVIPAGVPHFVATKEGPVVVQIYGTGKFGTDYLEK